MARKLKLSRYARTIRVRGQFGEMEDIYTRLPKREYEARRDIFDSDAPTHLSSFSYDE